MRLLIAIALVGAACAEDVLPPQPLVDLAASGDDLAAGVDLAQSSAFDVLAAPPSDLTARPDLAGLLCEKYGQPTPIDFIGDPFIRLSAPAADAPQPLGGTIVDGIYVVTRETFYAGTWASTDGGASTNTNTRRVLLVLEGGAWFYRDSIDPNQLAYAGGFLTISPSGKSVALGYPSLCGTGGAPYPFGLGYTATPTTFTTYWSMLQPRDNGIYTLETVYTRQ